MRSPSTRPALPAVFTECDLGGLLVLSSERRQGRSVPRRVANVLGVPWGQHTRPNVSGGGVAGRPIEAQCHPTTRVAVGDAEASGHSGKRQNSSVFFEGWGRIGWAFRSRVPRPPPWGEPARLVVKLVEINRFAAALARPVRP